MLSAFHACMPFCGVPCAEGVGVETGSGVGVEVGSGVSIAFEGGGVESDCGVEAGVEPGCRVGTGVVVDAGAIEPLANLLKVFAKSNGCWETLLHVEEAEPEEPPGHGTSRVNAQNANKPILCWDAQPSSSVAS